MGNDQSAMKPQSFYTKNRRGKWVWNSNGATGGYWTWTPSTDNTAGQSDEIDLELEIDSWTENKIEFDQASIPDGEYDLEIQIGEIKVRFKCYLNVYKLTFHFSLKATVLNYLSPPAHRPLLRRPQPHQLLPHLPLQHQPLPLLPQHVPRPLLP